MPEADEPIARRAVIPRLKHGIRQVLRRLGYEICPRRELERWAFVEHLVELFRRLDVQCVLDVGANRGQYQRFLREQVGYRGRIVSFEPLSHNVSALRQQQASDPDWIVQGYALGSRDDRMAINVMKVDLLSSFLAPHPSMVEMFRDFNVVERQESVEVRCLDAVLGALVDERFHDNLYLKLDTQGFDLEVIRGAVATLPRVRALQTEISMQPLYMNAPSYRDALDALTARGFAVTGMFPVIRDRSMRVVEFDCVMVNDSRP